MKTFAELRRETLSTDSLARRRDERNKEHKLTRAQREIQEDSAAALSWHLQYLDACDRSVAQGKMHPLDHPLASYYAERRRDELLKAQHPATMQHPLQAR